MAIKSKAVFLLETFFDYKFVLYKKKGQVGFEKHMDHLMDLAEYQVKRIKEQPDKFYLILEPELVNVSFWYIPKRLRGVPHSPAKEKELGKVSNP